MAKKAKFYDGIGNTPVSADPANPSVGQQQESDGTHRAEGLWRYNGTDWVRLGGGGAIISDWVDFTPTGTWTGAVTYTGRYRRLGGSAEIQYKAACTGAPTGTVLLFDTPPGLSVDETKIVTSDGTSYTSGVGEIKDDSPSSSIYNLVGRYNSSANQIAPVLQDTGLTLTRASAVTQISPITFGNTDNVILTVMLPIVGWETGILPNEISEGKLHAVEAIGNSSEVITTGVTNIPFTTILTNESAAWNGSEYTAQETGYYDFEGAAFFTDSLGRAIDAFIDTGSGYTFWRRGSTLTTADQINSFSFSGKLNQGDKVAMRIGGTGGTLNNTNANAHSIFVSKETNLSSQITPAETVAAKVSLTGGGTLPAATFHTIVYNTSIEDTNNSFNTGTGEYIAPIAGLYSITCSISVNATFSPGDTLSLLTRINGSSVGGKASFDEVRVAGTTGYYHEHSTLVRLSQGDVVDTQVYLPISGTFDSTVDRSIFEINKVGN